MAAFRSNSSVKSGQAGGPSPQPNGTLAEKTCNVCDAKRQPSPLRSVGTSPETCDHNTEAKGAEITTFFGAIGSPFAGGPSPLKLEYDVPLAGVPAGATILRAQSSYLVSAFDPRDVVDMGGHGYPIILWPANGQGVGNLKAALTHKIIHIAATATFSSSGGSITADGLHITYRLATVPPG